MMNFSTKVVKKLCPYLKTNAVRQEAASTAYSLPQAMKQCPYVKELYSGFETEPEAEVKSNFFPAGNLGVATAEVTEPKLFKMTQAQAVCPCENFDSSKDASACAMEGCMNKKESDTSLYDSKFNESISNLKEEGRYREFINVQRHMGSFPRATRRETDKKSEVVVW